MKTCQIENLEEIIQQAKQSKDLIESNANFSKQDLAESNKRLVNEILKINDKLSRVFEKFTSVYLRQNNEQKKQQGNQEDVQKKLKESREGLIKQLEKKKNLNKSLLINLTEKWSKDDLKRELQDLIQETCKIEKENHELSQKVKFLHQKLFKQKKQFFKKEEQDSKELEALEKQIEKEKQHQQQMEAKSTEKQSLYEKFQCKYEEIQKEYQQNAIDDYEKNYQKDQLISKEVSKNELIFKNLKKSFKNSKKINKISLKKISSEQEELKREIQELEEEIKECHLKREKIEIKKERNQKENIQTARDQNDWDKTVSKHLQNSAKKLNYLHKLQQSLKKKSLPMTQDKQSFLLNLNSKNSKKDKSFFVKKNEKIQLVQQEKDVIEQKTPTSENLELTEPGQNL